MLNRVSISTGNHCFFGIKSKEKVLIIDDFNGNNRESGIDVNGDKIPDFWHGQLAKGFLLASGPHKDLPEIREKQCNYNFAELKEIIKDITEQNNDTDLNNDVHMVGLSNGLDRPFKPISMMAKTEITPDNIHEKKKDLIPKMNFKTFTLKEFLSDITELTKTAKVYTAAGNGGRDFFNILSMADGIKTIGGLDEHGNPHPKSGNNSLIGKNDWAPFEFTGNLIKDKNGKPVGYDLAPFGQKGDGEADLVFDERGGGLSGNNPPQEIIKFAKTSYSAPYKLGRDYLARQKSETEWNPFKN